MSEAIKPTPTPGPWTQGQGACGSSCVWIDGHTQPPGGTMGPDSTWIDCGTSGNAALIAEAGTVHHETGLTPRQLFERRDALAKALEDVAASLSWLAYGEVKTFHDRRIMNPAEATGAARAALALVKGAKP